MGKNARGYYDIDVMIEDDIPEGWRLDELFYLQDLRQRKLYLECEVHDCSVSDIVKNIMQYNKEDRGNDPSNRKPIYLYISSNGGEVDAGFELIDAITSSKTPVYTINIGHEYSMAFLIGLAGHKRFATSNAKFLMHDGSNFVYGSGTKVQDQMEFQRRVEGRIKDYVIARSGVTEKEYDEKLRVEWYLFADEAKEKGFVDHIIVVDCDIDEIV